jgi:hypothetical protein
MSPRIIHLPMSGRDRRHYVRELRAAEQAHRSLIGQVEAAYRAAGEQLRQAHGLACEEWNTRQFIGGEAAPSPTIAQAIAAGRELLEVQCKRCGRTELVDLALVIWPREHQVHTLEKALRCQRCKREGSKSRANLVALRMREPIEPAPSAAARKVGRGQ